LLQHLVAIDVDELLRNAGQKSRTQAGDLRPLSRCVKKRIQVLRQELDAAARAVFEDERESARGANARDGWRRKTECDSRWQFGKLLIQMRLDRLKLLGAGRALVPRL
jgi:hypothetical protein